MKIFLSHRAKSKGGGSNTFAWTFANCAKKKGHKIVKKIYKADAAIIIAHLAEIDELKTARQNGCKIIHRLDEYFEKPNETYRKNKHQKIIELNKFADVTVYQSRFVFENVHPILQPGSFEIIHNGADTGLFYPAATPGKYIGHVTWGVGEKKRLDLLHRFIEQHPELQFLLIGRHKFSPYDFNFPNVKSIGEVKREKLPAFFHQMKLLYFPSENDPCPNTVIEAILCGVPVSYNPLGGTVELVRGGLNSVGSGCGESNEDRICGEPLEHVNLMLSNLQLYRDRCLNRSDLHFERVFQRYLSLLS